MRSSAPAPDVAIIGGGIVGAATAAFLAAAGARVTLYEQAEIAAGASGRNSGVVQHPHDAVLAALHLETLDHYRALSAELDGAFALPPEPAGLLYVGRDLDHVRRIAAEWRDAHPATEPQVLDGRELRRLEPGLADDLVACRLRVGYPVAPAAATAGYATLAERRGARIVLGGPARVVRRSGVAVGVEVDGRIELGGAVIVTAGPWSPALVDPTGAWRPIAPVWGVVAQIDLADPPGHVLEEAAIGIEPDDDGIQPDDADVEPDHGVPGRPADAGVAFSLVSVAGATSLGSTFLGTEPDPRTFEPALRAHGATFVPAIAAARSVGLRVCARPVSIDGRPLIGILPGLDRAYVAAGHGPWGISTGPASARLIADLALGRRPEISAALDPARFGPP